MSRAHTDPPFPEVTAVAVYEAVSGKLMGRLRCLPMVEPVDERHDRGLSLITPPAHDVVYVWESAPDMTLNPALFPERCYDEVPGFLHDCTSRYEGPRHLALAHALHHHSLAQNAFVMLPCLPWDPPASHLFDATIHALDSGNYVPARTLEKMLERLPSEWQGIAWERIMTSRFSEIERLIESELNRDITPFRVAS